MNVSCPRVRQGGVTWNAALCLLFRRGRCTAKCTHAGVIVFRISCNEIVKQAIRRVITVHVAVGRLGCNYHPDATR